MTWKLRATSIDAQDKLSDVGSSVGEVAKVDYSAQQNGSVLGDANYHINFATGSAEPLPDGVALLNQLKDSLAVTQAAIEVDGHSTSDLRKEKYRRRDHGAYDPTPDQTVEVRDYICCYCGKTETSEYNVHIY